MSTITDPSTAFDRAKAEVTEKVRKLLAKAEDPGCTTEEAEAFSAKAQSLISRFSIDLSVLGEGKRADELVEGRIFISDPYASAKGTLCNAIVLNNDCRAVWGTTFVKGEDGKTVFNKNGTAVKRRYLSVVGYATDVEWVTTLYASVEHQLTAAVARDRKAAPASVNLRSWTTSYIDGYTNAISRRLRESRQQVVAETQAKVNAERRALAEAQGEEVTPESTSVALVLVAKTEKVKDEYRRRYPHTATRTTYRRGGSSYAGRSAGQAAGAKASLARGSVGGSGRALGR